MARPLEPGEAVRHSVEYRNPDGSTWGFKHYLSGPDERVELVRKDRNSPVPPLYAAERLAGIPDGSTVWVVHSEQVADALWETGRYATTFARASWQARRQMSEAAAQLSGMHAVIWRRDTPAGIEWARVVRLALSGIAASVRQAACPPGDVQRALREGLNPEDFLARAPSIDVDGESVIVRVDGDRAEARFTIERVAAVGRDLLAAMSISYGSHDVPYSCEINIRSQSARETLCRQLKGLFGDAERWPVIVARAVAAVEEYAKSQVSAQVWTAFDGGEYPDLVQDLIVDRAVTVLYGTGASLKSMIALSLSMAVASGQRTWWGQEILDSGPVLWVDYEDAGAVKQRLSRLAAGAGIDPGSIPLWIVDPAGSAFADIAQRVGDEVRRTGARLLVVDSAMHAVAGPAEDSSSAISFLSSVRKLGIPALVISHTNRQDSRFARCWGNPDMVPGYPYGNVVWRNLARRTLYQRAIPIGKAYAVELVETKTNAEPGFRDGLRLFVSFKGGISISRPAWLEWFKPGDSLPEFVEGQNELPLDDVHPS